VDLRSGIQFGGKVIIGISENLGIPIEVRLIKFSQVENHLWTRAVTVGMGRSKDI
jgi:hypothetical protein